MTDAPLLRPWILATGWGWLAGIPLIAALALLGEAVGIARLTRGEPVQERGAA
jgi:hypothetical protein